MSPLCGGGRFPLGLSQPTTDHLPRPSHRPTSGPAFPPLRRQWQVYRRALPGLNSTAVGLIVTSVFQLTLSAYDSSPFPTTSICIGMLAYGATEVLAIPAPIVVSGERRPKLEPAPATYGAGLLVPRPLFAGSAGC